LAGVINVIAYRHQNLKEKQANQHKPQDIMNVFIPVDSLEAVVFEPLSTISVEEIEEGQAGDGEREGPHKYDYKRLHTPKFLLIILHLLL